MIEALAPFPGNVVAIACKGRVTRHDYENVLVPIVNKALEQYQKVRVYYEIGADYEGVDPGAIWEDFKVGMGHWSRWERIAVVTDVDWIKHTIRIFGFLMPGALRIYPLAEAAQARAWIVAE